MATVLPEDAPTVIINHGLTGGSHESYVRKVANWVQTPWDQGGLGGRAVIVNVSALVNPSDVSFADVRIPL